VARIDVEEVVVATELPPSSGTTTPLTTWFKTLAEAVELEGDVVRTSVAMELEDDVIGLLVLVEEAATVMAVAGSEDVCEEAEAVEVDDELVAMVDVEEVVVAAEPAPSSGATTPLTTWFKTPAEAVELEEDVVGSLVLLGGAAAGTLATGADEV